MQPKPILNFKDSYNMNLINSYRFGEAAKSLKFTITATAGGSFTIPHESSLVYNYAVNWGDGNNGTVTAWNGASATHTYTNAGNYQIEILGVCESLYFNNAGDKLKIISVDDLGTIEFKLLNFYGCTNMTAFNTGTNPNTSKVTSFLNAFRGCSVANLDLSYLKTDAANSLVNMFYACTCTTINCNNWNVTSVLDIRAFVQDTNNLTTLYLNNWNLSSVNAAVSAFENAINLVSIVGSWVISGGANLTLSRMFKNCNRLVNIDTSQWTLTNAVNLDYMFERCLVLVSIDSTNWNLNNATTMQFMFNTCTLLQTINTTNWGLASLIYLNSAFQLCPAITAINSTNWSLVNCINANYAFYGCNNITSEAQAAIFWNNTSITAHISTFYNNTARINWASIPVSWR